MTKLSEVKLKAISDALNGGLSQALISLMVEKNLKWPLSDASLGAVDLAASLGWLESENKDASLSLEGQLMADPLRELYFWREREGRLHNQGLSPVFDPERYRGKRVLEVGSGFGCNLLTLGDYADSVIGLEIQELYLQIAPILFDIEGKALPQLQVGQGESLPVPNNSQDVVMIFGALQYMDIVAVMREVERVLAPGGEFITINGYLGSVCHEFFDASLRRHSFREAFRAARTAFDSLVYEYLSTRLHRGHKGFSTSVPVYPTIKHQKRMARSAGLIPDETLTSVIKREVCLVCRKPEP